MHNRTSSGEGPAIFNPTAFDADPIIGTLARSGFKAGHPHLQAPLRRLPVADQNHGS
ncbi:MAG: hypothetical protein NTW21_13580 [Verrucomicrobia bacterium]|nr:hypothetical protein [Verrucomicrobiota bacterium]